VPLTASGHLHPTRAVAENWWLGLLMTEALFQFVRLTAAMEMPMLNTEYFVGL
jgi:hypothetical protein